MVQVTVLKDMQDCQRLQGVWQELTELPAEGIFRLGACMSFEWTMALWKNHLRGQPQHILVAEEAGEVLAILPCYSHRGNGILGLRLLTLSAFPELYYTRAGLLCRPDRPDAIAALLAYRGPEWAGWTRLAVSVVEGSPSQQLLNKALQATGLSYSIKILPPSPYIELAQPEEEFFAGLDGYFRKKIRQRERKLGESGQVMLTVYEKPDDVLTLVDIIKWIERASWKEKEGTSITKNQVQEGFYRLLLPEIASQGWLLASVLLVGEKPIAYQLGINFNGVLDSLKTSYVQEYRNCGPGVILKNRFLSYLYKKNICYCDLLGVVDEFKKIWAKKTYCHIKYTVYREGIAGHLLKLHQKINDKKRLNLT